MVQPHLQPSSRKKRRNGDPPPSCQNLHAYNAPPPSSSQAQCAPSQQLHSMPMQEFSPCTWQSTTSAYTLSYICHSPTQPPSLSLHSSCHQSMFQKTSLPP